MSERTHFIISTQTPSGGILEASIRGGNPPTNAELGAMFRELAQRVDPAYRPPFQPGDVYDR